MRPTEKDLRLLFELSENSRKPHSRIGKKIRISQQMVSYKLKHYLEEGVITSFYPLIDYSRFGYLSFKVSFKINYISRQRFLDLISTLSKEGDIVEITERGGKYDVILDFAARNPSSFNKTIKKIMLTNPQLKNHSILTTVVRHYFPRKYLIGEEKNTRGIIIGGDREPLVIDTIDRKVLFALQQNAVASSIEIAKNSGVNPKTVISRIKKLQKREIIKGFRPLLHLQNIGYKVNKILLTYHNLSPEREELLKNFCTRNPHITEFTKLFGEWDAEITVETKTMEEFRNVYILLREKFQDIIQDSEDFPVFKIHKKHFLPQEFFE